jgi:putative metallohydrolase (TIGR04338 family)
MAVSLGPRQAALYAVEDDTIAGLGLRWRRIAEVQAYVDRLIASAWFFERWPSLVSCSIERRGSGSTWSTCQHLDDRGPEGRATEGVILLADGCLRQPVVLHELAHLLLPRGLGHEPAFAETLLMLVRREMGFFAFADCYQALRSTEAFRDVRPALEPVP